MRIELIIYRLQNGCFCPLSYKGKSDFTVTILNAHHTPDGFTWVGFKSNLFDELVFGHNQLYPRHDLNVHFQLHYRLKA